MKKYFFLGTILAFFLTIFQSCENERVTEDNVINFENMNISKLITMKNQLHFENQVDLGKYEGYISSQFYQDKEDAEVNNFITNEIDKENNRVDAVVFFQEKEQVKGLGIYCYNTIVNELDFYLFRIENNKLSKIEGFPKTTINYIFYDITFVANNYFNNSSINLAYRDINIDYPNLSKEYNDLALIRVIFELKHISLTNKVMQQKTKPRGDGCGMTFSCYNGEAAEACIPSGCIGVCKYAEVKNGLNNSNFNKLLPENKLYEFKDFLYNTRKGRIYVDAYYRLGAYFYEMLDSELTLKTISTASTVRTVIDRLLDNSFSGLIINDSEADLLIELLQLSRQKSSNLSYDSAVMLLIKEINSLKNKNKNEFMTQLNG